MNPHSKLEQFGHVAPWIGGLFLAATVAVSHGVFAASVEKFTRDYLLDNHVGRTVVPLPDGEWHKMHEEREDHDAGSGDLVSNNVFSRTFLVQVENNNVVGVVYVRTNIEFLGGRGIKPSNFCFFKKWKYLKQESVLGNNTFCWGAKNFRFRAEPREGGSWRRAVEKIKKKGWTAPLGDRGSTARYIRSDKDKYLNVQYMFVRSNRIYWQEARDWIRNLRPRIQAGFAGKVLGAPEGGGPDAAVEPGSSRIGAGSSGEIETRLRKLKSLYDKGLISKSEYETKKAGILKGL